jgi:hypothetical protein
VTQPENPAKEENPMKIHLRKYAPALGAFVAALLLVPASQAQCGGINLKTLAGGAAIHPQLAASGSQLARYGSPADQYRGWDDDGAIVGFWHVKFISEGSTGIPDGTPVDAGYSQWHSDGTEIMNSGGRAPITSDFCLGVWKAVSYHSYKLNHFATAWDPTPTTQSPNGTLLGPAQIQEQVKLDADGDSFAGTFTIDQYDESGDVLAHVQGNITGTRITVDTAAQSIF